MNARTTFRQLVRLASAHPTAVRWLVGAVVAWVGLCFALGCRLPWLDRHPDWPQFPHLTTPRLVVEEIPNFEERYGHRFPFVLARPWAEQGYFSDVYRTNLRNVRSLGFQVTDNRFEPGFSLRLHWPGPNSVGRRDDSPTRIGFHNKGYEYLEIRLGHESCFFKLTSFGPHNEIARFYQYNYPRTIQDTLYLRFGDDDWRVVYR
jgi:hypothetical protein